MNRKRIPVLLNSNDAQPYRLPGQRRLLGRTDRQVHVFQAHRFWHRLRGLLGRQPLPVDAALWLKPCTSVHTLGMKYPLDLVFLDREGRILKQVHQLKSGRIALGGRSAHSVVEFAGGSLKHLPLKIGEPLFFPLEHQEAMPERRLAEEIA